MLVSLKVINGFIVYENILLSSGDKSLTTGNVIRLLREREFRFGKNWRGVARELGVSLEKRDQLSSLHLDADFSDFFEETIDDWLRNSDDPSWIKLIGVIDLFDKSVARDLRTYLGGKLKDTTTSIY